jgi:beta-lactamase superfamily II metal-dependent hydrolase/chitodextrinase
MIQRILVALSIVLTPALAAAQLKVVMIDVGQGDAIAVISPSGCAALFDGGETGSGAAIKSSLASLGVTHLDFAVASHYHEDHIGGLDEVEKTPGGIPIGVVYDRGSTYSSTAYTQYATQFSGRRRTAVVGQIVPLCEASLKVVAVNANGLATTNENALSVVMKLTYGAFDALLGGDLQSSPTDVEGAIASAVGEVEVYKVHHHGSATSSSATLLGAMQPVVSLISVGINNTYGHPTAAALTRIQAVGSAIWETEDPSTGRLLGDIVVSTSNGTTFAVTQGTSTFTYTSHGLTDITPPSTPTGLTAVATSASAVSLQWTASTDDVAVTGYLVYRSLDGITFASVATTDVTTFADTGLTASTTYRYRVTAVDAAGNESAASAVASVTTKAATPAKVIINEILANEPGSSTAGEFVELVNVGGASISIAGWTISDATSVRHTFAAGTTLAPGKGIVVFGAAAGIPAGVTNAVAASTGSLSLGNSGDSVKLASGATTVDSYTYAAALAAVDGVSMNRSPDATAGAAFVLHTSVSSLQSSPGKRANGSAW